MREKEPSGFLQPEQGPPDNALEQLRSRGSLGHELDKLGVVSVRPFPEKSRNEVFVGANAEGQRFHIKLYTDERPGLQGRTDIVCYKQLGDKLPLPRLFTASEEDGYIVTEFVELRDVEQTKQGVADVIDLIETTLATTEAPFLPEIKMEYYDEKLLRKFRELGEEGIVTPEAAAAAVEIVRSKREEITNRPRVFSHQDFKFENIKRDSQGNIVIIDPEFARQDIPEHDAAAMLADLADCPELVEYARGNFQDGEHVRADLLDAIELRRCVEIMRGKAMQKLPDSKTFQKHLRAFQEIVGRY